MLLLVLLLTLQPTSHSIPCPCDVTPLSCDLNCCCDLSCSAEQILTFTCPTFLLSDSNMCCQDRLVLSSEGKYQNTRTCSSNLACLQDIPATFGVFSERDYSSDKPAFRNQIETTPGVDASSQTQYTDSDLLLQDNGKELPSRFMFPVQYYGDQCAMSPVKFYSEIMSSCRKRVDVKTLCKADSVLDYHTYLKKLLPYPVNKTSLIDLSDSKNIAFYCLDSSKNVKKDCTASIDPATAVPKVDGSNCVNVVSEVKIYLNVSDDKMTLSKASVFITLTALPNIEQHQITQKFSITYKPVSSVDKISGNFGYVRGSHILSGTISGTKVEMNSDSNHRVLSLFRSQDCRVFSDHPVDFGTGYYTGCKMELPDYNFKKDSTETYCQVIKDISSSVFNKTAAKSIVVGTTGKSNTSDTSQWVFIVVEPDLPNPVRSEVKCSDVINHVTYKIFYTEVGEKGNLQSVITAVRAQYTTQEVSLHCNTTHCSSTTPQYLVLSNSVQFHYNTPSPRDRYKVNPRTTALLPLDFFYPLTAAAEKVRVAWSLVFFYCFLLIR